MVIYGNFNEATVMTKKEIPSKKEAGKTYYNLGVVANNELGEIPCTEDVFRLCEIGKKYDFQTSYRTDYQMFQLTSVANVHKGGLVFSQTAEQSNDKK